MTARHGDENAPKKVKKRYIASLDGLRALAVIAVICYHLDLKFALGGLLGVTVFFVLSGYLITGLLMAELEETGTVNLPQFWLRRVRRLFPAIVLVVVVVTALCVLFNHPLLTKLRPDVGPSLFWFQNWWYVFRGLSYFESLGDPSPLTHFWSLAIEEQFYLVWPILLLLVSKLGASKTVIRRGCLALAVISAALMWVLYNPLEDPTRVYYGTDTRACSLLIGAWLSLFWPGQALTEQGTRNVPSRTINLLDVIGVLSLAGIICMMAFIDGFSGFMYHGGIVICSVLTAVLIAVLVHPRSRLAKFASLKPFVWIGQRSYGIYLWHYPVILLLKPLNGPGDYTWWFVLAVFAITFTVSALSYTFVENPIRHGAIGKALQKWRERRSNGFELRKPRVIAPALASLLTLAIAVGGCAFIPDEFQVPQDAIKSTGAAVGSAMQLYDTPPSYEPENGVIGNAVAAANYLKAKADREAAELAEAERLARIRDPLLIGDSVPGDSADEFYSHYTNALMDSYIGRWFWQARDVYKDYEAQGVVGDVVIFACFSNFVLEGDELDKMYELVGPDKQIFLVNVYNEKIMTDVNNAMINEFATRYDNVHVIDWYAACNGHASEYLWDDHEHLRPEGAVVYQDLIFDSVKGYLPAEAIREP